MSLREHILLDQLTGPDIPVRNSMLFHGLDPLITKTFPLRTLHDRKRKATFHSFSDKVDHNIVSVQIAVEMVALPSWISTWALPSHTSVP